MSDLDLENICRLCCEKKGRLRSLFEQKSAKVSLSLQQMITDVTRLEITPGDGLPQKICRLCTTTLAKMYESIQEYRENDSKLRQRLVKPYPLVEIKEEEVDIEQLENIYMQDLVIDNICIKKEEEVIDNKNEDADLNFSISEGDVPDTVGSETDTANEGFQEDDADDDEWKPSDETEEKVIKRKSQRKNSKEKKTYRVQKYYRLENVSRPRSHDFKCYICKSDSFGTGEALLVHLNGSHLGVLPYSCSECVTEKVVIKTIVALNNHKRQHMNPEKCPYCDKRYTCKKGVDLHISMHHRDANDPNPSQCEYCDKVYPTKQALRNHMRIHTSGSTCEICGKVFLERNKLKRHIQTFHEKLKKYECHFCKKKLASMSAVQNHINTYHSSQVFKCSYCPKTFSSKMTHRYHEKKHVENKNYVATKDWREYYTVLDGQEDKLYKSKKCKICGIVTTNIAPHLTKAHFPTEYRCEICDKTFKTKPTFTAHMDVHVHGKVYKCPICGREFNEKRNLISHLRTKKHRNHPLAREILGTVRTPNPAQLEQSGSEEDDESTQE